MHDKILEALKYINEFSIPLSGLKEGWHQIEYVLEDKFFDLFDNSEVSEGNLSVMIKLHKTSRFSELHFAIDGVVVLDCDRCLKSYSQEIGYEGMVVIKFGEQHNESDDIITISENEGDYNVAHLIYEFIIISLPYKRIHTQGNNGESGCDPEMIKRINELTGQTGYKSSDTIWEELKKLKY